MAKIGFYGGCFNPPTKAHIEMAKKAIKECNLDKVIFVPVGDSYEKEGIAKGKDRYNMLKLACENEDRLLVSDIETKSKVNYKAIEIFDIIDKENEKDEKFFLMGVDNLKKLSTWTESKKLVNNFNYIILERDNLEGKSIIDNDELLKNHKERFVIVKNNDFNDCSSTDVRQKIKYGKKPDNINEKVYKYIMKNNIY